MKKNLLSIALLLILVISACARQKQVTTTSNTSSSSTPAAKKLDVSYVRMYRTTCFGRCPNYQVEVYDNGLVRYTGYRNIKDSGVYEKNIGTAVAQDLLGNFEQYRLDTLKDLYDLLISDIQGTNYTFTINGKKKDIGNAHFGPAYLKTLAKMVDKLVRREGDVPELDATWTRTGDAKKD